MTIFKFNPFIVALILLTKISISQEFVDDLYFNDSEVDYEFLYSKNISEENVENDSIVYNNDQWDDEISYEDRIHRFQNPYYSDSYWGYGWEDPYSRYGWNRPYWGSSFSLNWGYGWNQPYWGNNFSLNWGYGWNRPYWGNDVYFGLHLGYGWHDPFWGLSYYGNHHHHYANQGIHQSNVYGNYGHRKQKPTNIKGEQNPIVSKINKEKKYKNQNKITQENKFINKVNNQKNWPNKSINKKKKSKTKFEKFINGIDRVAKEYINKKSEKSNKSKYNNKAKNRPNSRSSRSNNRSSKRK